MTNADRWFISMWMCCLSSQAAKSEVTFWSCIALSVFCGAIFMACKDTVRN